MSHDDSKQLLQLNQKNILMKGVQICINKKNSIKFHILNTQDYSTPGWTEIRETLNNVSKIQIILLDIIKDAILGTHFLEHGHI